MTKLEQVARAICKIVRPQAKDNIYLANGLPVWTAYLPEARAAVEALREPTEGMVAAAEAVDAVYPAEHYRAMVTAILNEKP